MEVSGSLYILSPKASLIPLSESGVMGSSLLIHSDLPKDNSPPRNLTLNVHLARLISMISICIHALPISTGGTSLSAKGINNFDHLTKPRLSLYFSSGNQYHLRFFRSFSNFFCSESSLLFSGASTTGSGSSSSHSSFSL
ncbi:MAG: hypothetical protein WCL18_06760 [bacterium]